MLKAISKEVMIDKNGNLDRYAFIRSPEIREYMRKNETFNSSDTIVLILKSMNPWEAKLEALKIPAHEESLPLPRYEIVLVYPVKNYKNNNPIHFSATWFNGTIGIYAIHADSGWGEAHCFKHKITNYLAGGWMGRYSLPFPTMSKVKLQTPFMRRPLSGILESTLDDCHCWYHFFYPYDGRGLTGHFMDFSYQEVESGSDLTIFDWVSTDSGK